jgi:PII-like signaling protein
MENNSAGLILRVFISSTDKDKEDRLLYESIVFKAKEKGLAGSTVLKGILGFGASSVIQSYKFWELTEKLPVIVEIIDEEDKIMAFYETIKPILESMRYGCLVTTEKIDILMYKKGVKFI